VKARANKACLRSHERSYGALPHSRKTQQAARWLSLALPAARRRNILQAMSTTNYTPLHGLPALAGLTDFDAARMPGLAVEESVRRLKRFHFALRRLNEILLARITAEPIYELKMGFSLHAHLCAEHVAALRARVGEMREPPLGLEVVPDVNLEIYFDEILAAPDTLALLGGVYADAIPALIAAMEKYAAEVNPLADAPSRRLLRFALLELREMEDFGAKAIAAMSAATGAGLSQSPALRARLSDALAAAGGLDGTGATAAAPVARLFSARPYRFDPVPRRDERFPDPYNMAVNAEVFLHDPAMPAPPKTLMMYYRRLREIDVPEMMASIIVETKGKPWGYYRDMTRQLWDEARHAMMGEVGFVDLGVDWRKVMVNFTWSLGLNTQLAAKERHGVLYFIEQGQMPKTGKRYEWEVAQEAGNPLAATFQDFDWADEVLHARVGRDWYVSEFENAKDAIEYGDRCWSKVLMGWREWRDQGLTKHRNWWPDVYRAACEQWGSAPDPDVLAYDTTYETTRADLKVIAASA
jgi:hypothetical protein